MVHSKHGVTPGTIILAWPLKPSVPPSTIGLNVSSRGLSSESYSKFPNNNETPQMSNRQSSVTTSHFENDTLNCQSTVHVRLLAFAFTY